MTSEELREEVKNALDKIRPYLQNDGGDITLVDIEDDKIVKVRLEGTCTNCAVNQMTLKSGVEMTIKELSEFNIEMQKLLRNLQPHL